MRIREVRITPVAIKDPPLLNTAGVHQPFALRSIIELETDEGHSGLSETYGDSGTLANLRMASGDVIGVDPFDVNGLRRRLAALAADGDTLSLGHGVRGEKAAARLFSAFEVAFLDLQGKALGRPVCDLLGGAVRSSVPYSGYLFFRFGRHRDQDDEATDGWGEALTPEAVVEQARRMHDRYGFRSFKLKGGVFEPEVEVETINQLRSEFPGYPLRIDPNGAWTVATSIRVAQLLRGAVEYLEDPTSGMEAMAAVARAVDLPLATNMIVTTFGQLPEAIARGCVGVVLADHHYWNGFRGTQELAAICRTWGLGMSMHSNSHLGISLAAMTHIAASVPELTYACDTHRPWQQEDVVTGLQSFHDGALPVPDGPGLGVHLDRAALDRLHDQYLRCGIRDRDDTAEMRKYEPSWTLNVPRF